jgi:hypothetical protein
LSKHENLLRFGGQSWLLEILEIFRSHSLVLEVLAEAETSLSSQKFLSLNSLLLSLLLLLLFFVRRLSIQEVLDLVENSKWTGILGLCSAWSSLLILLLLVWVLETVWVLHWIIVEVFLLLLVGDLHHLEFGVEPSVPLMEWKLDLLDLLK